MEHNREKSSLVFGKNAALELLKSSRPIDTLYIDARGDEKLTGYYTALAKTKGAVVKRVHANKLDEMCGSKRHQGIAAALSLIEYSEISDILETAGQRREAPFVIMADSIEDPHNLGAIIRTARAAGAHGIIIPKRGSAQINETVQRASAGAVNHLAVARVPNLANAVRELKKAGLFCYCADPGGQRAFETDLDGPILLIIGSEGFGVSRLLRELSDAPVSLPMREGAGSLNASVAAGALIYEIVRQRLIKDEVRRV